jgi:hypothetical protein
MITLGVSDLNRAVVFYRDGLGLELKSHEGEIAFFKLRGSWLALYPWDALAADVGIHADGSGFRGVTLAHNVETPEQVDALLEQAVAAGARLVKQGRKVEWGGYSGYFSDPDGHLWEVAHNPFSWIGPPPVQS